MIFPRVEGQENVIDFRLAWQMLRPGEAPMTAKELQDWITSHLHAKRLTTTVAKKVIGNYGVTRTMDTKEEDRPKIVRDLMQCMQANAS